MSETTYFVLLNKQEAGPFTLGQIQAMVAKGEIPPHTFYAAPGMTEWQHVSDLLASVAAPPPPPPAAPRRVPVTLPPPSMAPPPAVEKTGGSRKKMLLAGGALGLVLTLLAAGRFLWPHTPKSSEPPPANVSYKKREKFSEMRVAIPLTGLEKNIGRNLHRTAFQAATNLVALNLNDPERARFRPFKEATIVGTEWRFRVQGQMETTKKSGETKLSDYEIYLKRSADEEWTVEGYSSRKTTDAPVRTDKATE